MWAKTKLTHYPNKPKFQPNRCRGVSHTPSRERKWNDGGEHIPIVRCALSPMWRAYAIRPYSFTLSRDDAKTTWSHFMPKLFTVQDHFYIVQCPFVHGAKPLELTSRPFCTRANPLEPTSRPFCTRATPLELTSIPFCTRRKPPWTNFKAFLYTCKTVMQTFKNLLFTMQNRPANVQGPIVSCAKPPC